MVTRLRADLIEVYRIIHGLSTARFSTFFELGHNERTRGHSLKLHKKRVTTDLRQHFFSDRIVDKWNTLSVISNGEQRKQAQSL